MFDDTPPGILLRIPAGDAAAPLVPNKLLGKESYFGAGHHHLRIDTQFHAQWGMVTMALGLPKQ